MPGWAKGQFQADYEQRIDFGALRTSRLERARAVMREQGVDAVFVWRDENVRYLSSLRAIMIQYRASTTYGVFMHRDGDPVLFLSSGELARAERDMPWITRLVPIPIMDEAGLVEEVVREKVRPVFADHGVLNGKVALDAMTFQQHRAYAAHLPNVEWVDGDSLMNVVRRVKVPQEIALLEEVTALADAVVAAGTEAVRAGVRECEVSAAATHALFRLGGEFGHLASPFVASGERMAPPTRFPTDKIIRHGDLVFMDIGASWNGYFADVGRTVVCGRPSPEQSRVYRAVYDSLQAGLATIRPGVSCSDVARAFRLEAERHGLADRFINLFIGHGIGCAPTEHPFVGETMPGAEDAVLEAGMVLALEPLIWVEGVRGGGGVRIEDMVLVTETGAHVMSRAPYDDRLLA